MDAARDESASPPHTLVCRDRSQGINIAVKADEKTILTDGLSAGLKRSRVRHRLLLTLIGVLVTLFGAFLFAEREAQAKQKGNAPGGGSSLKEAAGSGAGLGGSKRSHGSGAPSAPSTSKLDSASAPIRDHAPERTPRPDLEPATAVDAVTKPVDRVSDPVSRAVEPALKTAGTISAPAAEMAEPTVGSVGTSIEPVRGVVEPIREVVEPVVSPVVGAIEPLGDQSPLPVEVASAVSEPAPTEPVASALTAPEPVVELPPVVGPDLALMAADPVPDPVRETAGLVAGPDAGDSIALGSTPPGPSANPPVSFSQPVAAPPASGAEEHATGAFRSSPATPEDQGMPQDRTFIGDHSASGSLSQVEQAPEQPSQQPAYPGPAAPTGAGASLRGSGFEPYNGLGLATLALLLALSPAGVRLLRSSRESLTPDSALRLAVEHPG